MPNVPGLMSVYKITNLAPTRTLPYFPIFDESHCGWERNLFHVSKSRVFLDSNRGELEQTGERRDFLLSRKKSALRV